MRPEAPDSTPAGSPTLAQPSQPRGVAGAVPDVVALGEAAGQLEADGLELEPAARGAEQEPAVADRPVGLEIVDDDRGDGAQHGALLGAER